MHGAGRGSEVNSGKRADVAVVIGVNAICEMTVVAKEKLSFWKTGSWKRNRKGISSRKKNSLLRSCEKVRMSNESNRATSCM